MTKHSYPEFSVLMSVYKSENANFLDLALCSIEDQSVLPKEIVLVEDGPLTKDLLRVIDKHENNFKKEFKIIKSVKNQGLGKALRLGTNFVTTNWIARMDSDDIADQDRFKKQVQAIKSNPDLAVIGGQITEFSEEIWNIVGKRNVPLTEKEILKFLKWRSPFNHPTVMINKNILDSVGGYQEFGNLEDYYLWARIIAGGYEVKNLSDVLVHMRVDQGMYSRRGKLSNLKYVYRLRKYLYDQKLIDSKEKVVGNLLMTMNIIIPNQLRRLIYCYIIHK